MNVQKRNIVTAILFTFITCGIYGIYWYICLVDEVRTISNDNSLPSGGTAFVLSILTCGIYSFYIFYKLGKSLYYSKLSNSDNSILYLVCYFFVGILSYVLVQSELNDIIDRKNGTN